MENTKINLLIEEYEKEFEDRFKLEDYKWIGIKQFQDNWDINAENFAEMLEKSIYKFNFIHIPTLNDPRGMIIEFARHYPNEIKNMFQVLFNEDKVLSERLDYFKNKAEEMFKTWKNDGNGKEQDKNHYQGNSAASVYLWLKYPNKYNICKYTIVKSLAEYLSLSDNLVFKRGDNNNIEISIKLYEYIKSELIKHPNLINKFKIMINSSEEYYKDNELTTLAMDIGHYIYDKNNISVQEYFIKKISGAGFDLKNYEKQSEWAVLKNEKRILVYVPFKNNKDLKLCLPLEFDKFITKMPENVTKDIPFGADGYTYPKEFPVRINFKNCKLNNVQEFLDDILMQLNIIASNNVTNKNLNEDKNMAVNIPLNQILYGPPGTGKTYNTVVEALKIADKDFYNENKDNYTELHRKFNELKQAGQIEFVTFHQSYSYEEFVEGIKPDVTAEDLKYLQKDGAFKDICNKARKKEFSNFDETYNAFLEEIIEYEDENSKPFTLRTLKNKTFGVRVNSNKNLTLLMGKELKAWGTLTKHNLENISDWKYYANPIYTYLKEKYNLNTQNNEELKNYVLVIDEINRGNISKIFGELITLIEDDKRENLTVKLPYSQEEFTVPKNLYILGTMNTSDRSIAAVDIALRRRFKFKEMMPTSDIKGFREDFKERFEILNRRISFLLDRDHQIGHSYFLNNSDSLENIWYDNIMPLLNEYFYGDWEKLQNILGVAENENSDKTHKYNSFIKKISKSSLKLKGDTSCLDDYYYDFVPQENIDFEKAMKNAFGEISNEETNADN